MEGLDRLAFARRRASGYPAAIAASGQSRGGGIDFADYRPYSPGDDPRHVDWSLYARTRKLFLRRFHVESDPCLYLLVDKSGSMGLGQAPKLAFATRLAQALAYVGSRGNHAVGAATFSDRIETYLAPSRRRGDLGRARELLHHASPGGPSDLEQVFANLAARAPRPGLAVVFSDFFTHQPPGEALAILRRAGFEIAFLQILAEEEVSPLLPGGAEIWDVESRDEIRLRVGWEALARYREKLDQWNRSLREICAARGAIFERLESSVSLSEALARLIETGLLEVRRS